MELKTVLILAVIYIGKYCHALHTSGDICPPTKPLAYLQPKQNGQKLTPHKLSVSSLSHATRAQQPPCLTEKSPRSTSKSFDSALNTFDSNIRPTAKSSSKPSSPPAPSSLTSSQPGVDPARPSPPLSASSASSTKTFVSSRWMWTSCRVSLGN